MAAERIVHILDSSAMIAYLREESGALVVRSILTDPKSICSAHAINLCEVYYDAIRIGGRVAAEASLDDLSALGVIERNDFDSEFWREVGRFKADHRASLADFCGVVLTNRLAGTFVTSDHHEFDKIPKASICPVQFIR